MRKNEVVLSENEKTLILGVSGNSGIYYIIVRLSPVSLEDSHGSVAEIQCCIPSGREKLVHQRIFTKT